jgi:uncharacterized protein
MRCVDVNVLVYAHRPEAPEHDRYRQWLEEARRADEPLGLPSIVLAGFARVVTHPRVFRDPTPLRDAFAFISALERGSNLVAAEPGPRHWSIFQRVGTSADARGNRVPDAYLAAIAIERGATLYTADRGFARFADLRWAHPLDPDRDVPSAN